jgi:hypothetical protein
MSHTQSTEDLPSVVAADERSVRQQAIEQIQRKRSFWIGTFATGMAILFLIVIWATSEYQNAGGWPTDGFSQSSSIPHVWNIWIIYPVVGLLLLTAVRAWSVFKNKPVSESEIRREMDRMKVNDQPG